MNPYLEHPALWPEFHNRLTIAIADAFNPLLLPKYWASINYRVYELDGNETLLATRPKVPVEPLHPLTTSAPIGILPPHPSHLRAGASTADNPRKLSAGAGSGHTNLGRRNRSPLPQ